MTWITANLDLIWERTLAHLALAVPAIAASFLVALVIGGFAAGRRRLRAPLVTGAALLYAIPSLPLFIVLPALIGTGVRDSLNVVVALTLYGLALMVPAVVDALRANEKGPVDAARALGYTRAARFLTVELPLAGPTLLAGLRVTSVSTVSLVTVGAVLGVPSLGMLFTDGFQRGITAEILTGLVMTAVVALVLDAAWVLLGRWLLPWRRA
ncbi:ABC transporter permease [Tessaracoccus sp. Y36]|uniref:ABC transporter permease n=1 Tax=Tessaracoccus sp. MC1756 TaxID=2760311 RepID=UPI0016043F00|nr:ABC transporter permease subunit [Tessaracoccus sp. MC1756]